MALPPSLMNPPLMAMGDSLFNGMRSLTIDGDKTRMSPPAMVAKGLGLTSFTIPDLPRPVIVDLENWLEKLFPIIRVPLAIGEIERELRDSITFWATGDTNRPSPSGKRCFDNIAFAGSTIEDMYQLTAEDADARAREIAAAALQSTGLSGLTKGLGDLLVLANARFTLAPDPETSDANPFRRKTSLEIVAMRKPKRLLVSIGHNNGLIDIVLRADPAGAAHLGSEMQVRYPRLVDELCNLPDEVEHIYVNLLPCPSVVSSLMPTSVGTVQSPDLGRYFTSYETRFCYAYGTYTGERLYEIDKDVRAINEWIVGEFKKKDTKNRVHFVDVFNSMKAIDSKNNGRGFGNTFPAGSSTCTNEMFEANDFFPGRSGFKAGGLEGLDGIHLTTLGNGLMASWILDRISSVENVPIISPQLADIGRSDPLIGNPPNSWSWALWVYRDVMRQIATGKAHQRPPLEVKGAEATVGVASDVIRRMCLLSMTDPQV